MSRLLCCLCARRADMGAALSHPLEGEACDGGGVPAAPPTMADVIRERKKKAGGAGLGTLRRRIAAAARRPRDNRPDRGCEHARFVRSVVGSWRLAEVFLLGEQLEAGAALRDLATQAELAREPARALHADLAALYRDRWWCDVELVGSGWSLAAHRAVLHARCSYFRDLLQRYPPAPACWRVPLEGAAAGLSREQMEGALRALYAGSAAARCAKWECGSNADGDLDIINVDNNTSCARADAASLRRLGALLGFELDALHQDMRYLLDSGELADGRLEFRLFGGCGAAYGFRTALALPCHRFVLAARSRYFRSVLSRRAGSVGGGVAAVCVDECVLPRRFAPALLHAAYTDQVDLTLIGRNSSSPSSTNSGSSNATAWAGVGRGGATRPLSTAVLDDAFQFYEIARFLEMPIAVQGCEDAIAEALAPETLPHILRWAAAPHASQWVHRQAMRYLRDEFPAIMAGSACAAVPRAALADALASPFLQSGEAQALRALLRWGSDQPLDNREPNVVWHTAHSASRRGCRRRELSDAMLRDTLASLISLVRLEHIPPDNELLHQLVRRGIVTAPSGGGTADAWLGRGSHRPPRCLLPYLDEIKALLEGQAVPEAELALMRRERYLHRIPDTLYMVAAARGAPCGSPGAGGLARACVAPRQLRRLARRARELRAAPPAARALRMHADDPLTVYKQIALRAVREMSLPDSCAELLLADLENDRERDPEEWESASGERECSRDREQPREPGTERWVDEPSADCCRALGAASARCSSSGSVRSAPALHASHDNSRAGTCRREAAPRADNTQNRSPAGARLSAAVPDVAMAPNANTHLLTARDYFRHAPPWEYGGGVLQLDLGDGATHTPRPGSRAQRAGAAHSSRSSREPAQAISCLRSRADEDELRAAIELSVIRAYSSLGGRGAATLPLAPRHERLLAPTHSSRGRSSASPSPLCAGGAASAVSSVSGVSGVSGASAAAARRSELHTPPHLPPSRSPSPSAARRLELCGYRARDHRLEGGYGSSGSASRGHSPNNYA